MQAFVILIRGINVGGKNKVSMAELKVRLTEMGFESVSSYINSGNILLRSKLNAKQTGDSIEAIIVKRFKMDSPVIKVLVLTASQLQTVVRNKPKGFGEQPDVYYSDAIFLMGLPADEALKVFDPREGVDKVWPGKQVIYSQRLGAERVRSKLSKIVGTPAYQSMTIRSWGTTTKLATLLDALEAEAATAS